jgi:hypothetical protein
LQVVKVLSAFWKKKYVLHSVPFSSAAIADGVINSDAPSVASAAAEMHAVRTRLAKIEAPGASVLCLACLLCLASLRWRIGLLLVIR